MKDGLVQFEGVWKKYRRGERHDSLRDLIPSMARALLRKRVAGEALQGQEFWALQDLDFTVEPGEALGIIGPNGAGKSTILKILTRLIRPTRGRSLVRGRIGSLIEIGGSLHPDLTGRENVYLQGSIMGMPRAEVTRKFDEIVEFAGLSDFIDTPVKRFSSGMNARLGFSVAAHLETDVLIIDEVLAVGDSAFQRKAFDRMQTMVQRGIPAVTVSHQLERIASLCTRAILLVQGQVAHAGSTTDCIEMYARYQADPGEAPVAGAQAVQLDSIALASADSTASGERIEFEIVGSSPLERTGARGVVGVRVRSLETGSIIYACGTETHDLEIPPGRFGLRVGLEMNVPPGLYAIESSVWQGGHERDSRNGPTTLIRVSGGPSFTGTVQMNSSILVRSRA
ncbi:MAG: ABC transporter ATP-binding protein [Candidatus Eisenbacteria bacterium]